VGLFAFAPELRATEQLGETKSIIFFKKFNSSENMRRAPSENLSKSIESTPLLNKAIVSSTELQSIGREVLSIAIWAAAARGIKNESKAKAVL
jgi:hypothetical protein